MKYYQKDTKINSLKMLTLKNGIHRNCIKDLTTVNNKKEFYKRFW